MATKTQVVLVDDLTGDPADTTVKFALDKTEYEIDLSNENAAEMRKGLSRYVEVFSPGFAVHGRAREASLQVSAVSRPSAECLLAGACSEGPRWQSLTTRCRPGQRRRSQPSTGTNSW
jgi:hypothetical protein